MTLRAALAQNEASVVGLKRSLTYWDLVLYGLAYIAPFAPLGTLGFVWSESNGLIVLAYLLGGFCIFQAITSSNNTAIISTKPRGS